MQTGPISTFLTHTKWNCFYFFFIQAQTKFVFLSSSRNILKLVNVYISYSDAHRNYTDIFSLVQKGPMFIIFFFSKQQNSALNKLEKVAVPQNGKK